LTFLTCETNDVPPTKPDGRLYLTTDEKTQLDTILPGPALIMLDYQSKLIDAYILVKNFLWFKSAYSYLLKRYADTANEKIIRTNYNKSFGSASFVSALQQLIDALSTE